MKKNININLNIKKRLVISNILMIVIPVAICACIALVGLALIWNFTVSGKALGFEDSEDFYERASGTAEIVENMILSEKNDKNLYDKISITLKNNKMYMKVYEGDTLLFDDGDKSFTIPENMLSALKIMDNDCTITSDEYYLYANNFDDDDGDNYKIFLAAYTFEPSYTTLKICVIILMLILITAVILSVYFTNRFLTKFVFNKIEDPLEELEKGVAEIRDGNLDYRINYTENTEFLPLCSGFNDMAMRLKASVEQTLQNEENRKELLAGISHDIRSPLTSIIAYADGLIDGVADNPEKQKKYLVTIKEKAESISGMVSELFLYSKLELESFPVNLTVVDIQSELIKIVSPIAYEYSNKGYEINMNVISKQISIDKELMSRICTNILSNSLKYNKNKNSATNIYSEISENFYILHFSDNGNGVDEKILERIFDVFYRNDRARNSPEKGSGLGLAIVYDAVKKMNGSVSAENVKGGGLDIILKLPLEENANE